MSSALHDLAHEISDWEGGTIADAKEQIERTCRAIASLLSRGKTVKLPGVGAFSPIERKARRGRNPQTGDEIEIPARKDVKFRAATALKEVL